jgi:hypothetical protein
MDLDLSAIIQCWAYDCEMTITINGVTLGYCGGSSYGGRLFGAAGGAEPAEPALLRVGDNHIEITYRRAEDSAPSPSTVEIMLPPAGSCFRLSTDKTEGRIEATFVIPDRHTEKLTSDQVHCVTINETNG